MTEPQPWGEYIVRPADLSPELRAALLELDRVERQIEVWAEYAETVKAQLKHELQQIKPFLAPREEVNAAAYEAMSDVELNTALETVPVNARRYLIPAELLGADKGRKLSFVANTRLDVKALRAKVPANLLEEFYVPQTTWKLEKQR